MRPGWQVLGAAALVVAVAAASTTVAVRHADATDARLRSAALSKARLELLQLADGSIAPGSTHGYGVTLHNDGTVGVVVRRATWSGGPALDLHAVLPVQGGLDVRLPLASPCPVHQVTAGLDHVDVQVEVAGGRRTLRLDLPDPSQPREQANAVCGLLPASQSLGATATRARAVRPGHLELDVSALVGGSQPVEVLGVHAAAGIDAHVVEALPRTVEPPPVDVGGQRLPHLLTVLLTLRDCALVARDAGRAQDGQQAPAEGSALPPRWFELQLDVRHPGEPVEQLDLSYPVDAANAFAAPCHVPVLATVTGL